MKKEIKKTNIMDENVFFADGSVWIDEFDKETGKWLSDCSSVIVEETPEYTSIVKINY